jgi:hypothetical protein
MTVGHEQTTSRSLMTLAAAGALGVVGGVLSALGRPEVTAILVGLVVVALVMSSRVAVFWFVLAGALVFTGLAQLYLPGSGARYVRYVVPLASFVLLLHWFSDWLRQLPRPAGEPMPGPAAWALAFAGTGLVSVLVNLSDPAVALLGARNYLQMGVFFLCLVFLRWRHDRLDRQLVRAMVALGLLQLPFALHQYFYLVPQRIGLGGGIVPVDIVAGTFGANLLGGGANSLLAAYQIIVVAVLLAMWKNNVLPLWRLVPLLLLLLAPLLVNQAKVAVLYLPLAFLVLFRRDFLVKPGKFLIAAGGTAALFALLMTALMLTHPSGRLHSWEELVDFVVERQTAPISERGEDYNALSRWTALTFWAEEHATANPVNTLVGHGLGASREHEGDDAFPRTLAERRYPGLGIGYTAVSSLLWDTGVVGLVAVLGMFASGFLMAGWLARHHRDRDPRRCALFEGLQAGIAVLALGLAHKDYFVVHIPYQTLVYLLIGYVASAWLQVLRSQGSAHVRWRV